MFFPSKADPIQERESAFRLATPGYAFSFPLDHGSHPGFRVEWWYVTGHLAREMDTSPSLGFQWTFFRIESEPGESRPWVMAHVALTDLKRDNFLHEERLARSGWDAWAKKGDLDLRHGNWRLKRQEGMAGQEFFEMVGSIESEGILELKLLPGKPLVVFGEDGVSRKGSSESSASHYITFTRLVAEGTLLDDQGVKQKVQGTAWMDHEFSSSQLEEGQAGWDWTAIQLEEGREFMAYRLRTQDGKTDPHSRYYWIGKNGQIQAGPLDSFEWKVLGQWKSPRSEISYPVEVEIQAWDPLLRTSRRLRLRPLLEEQEMGNPRSGITYWEGACEVLDEKGQSIGRAYLELAGYGGGLVDYLKLPASQP